MFQGDRCNIPFWQLYATEAAPSGEMLIPLVERSLIGHSTKTIHVDYIFNDYCIQMKSIRQKREEAVDSSSLSGDQRHIKCKDTFLDILNGAISESLEPIPRFYFVSPTRVLFVWVMDRELQGSY